MIKKMLIIATILVSLLMVSTFTAAAEKTTIKDYEDDVFDTGSETGEKVSRPNVDLTLLEYEQNDKTVTITLTVKGVIEDRGNFEDFENLDGVDSAENFSLDCVMYSIDLSTNINTYSAYYINNNLNVTCGGIDDFIIIEDKSFNVQDSKLTITFDLVEEDEELIEVYVTSSDASFNSWTEFLLGTGYWYMDDIPNLLEPVELDTTILGVPEKIKVNQKIKFNSEIDTDSSDIDYYWDFGDGTTSTEKNPSHVYTSPGDYMVTLEVQDDYYNTGSDSYTINVTAANNNDGPIDSNNEESTSSLLLFIALIAIIAIVGIAVVYFVIIKK